MNTVTIDSGMLAKMFLAGAHGLEAKKEWINELNVFPVPDGDTGTNMTMTIMSAAKEVSAADLSDMTAVCKAISSGSLRGARGNSGVILSQLLRGFTKAVKTSDSIDVALAADGFEKACETAYKAVMKPKEGTILTVAKGASQKARELANEGVTDAEEFMAKVIEYAEEVLAKTPEMLPVLKQAGVVDSGGQGLVEFLKGANDALLGKEVDVTIPDHNTVDAKEEEAQPEADIKFGYCTEFIILLKEKLNKKQEIDLKSFLESLGDSIVMVADDEICKIHVHTNDPGLAIQKALLYGQLSNMKIDNMRMEHREKLFHMNQDGSASAIQQEISGQAEAFDPQPVQYEMEHGKEIPLREDEIAVSSEHKEYGFVTVCAGSGMADIFRDLGVDHVIEGGQTMNPSTEDILNAIEKVDADTVFVLPNNKNIILAANQAVHLIEDKNVVVIPSKTVPQGISAVINFVPDLSVDENTDSMKEAISLVSTGEVTYAVRDTVIDDIEIKQGDYMGIGDSGILAVGGEIENVAFDMLEQLMDGDKTLISIYYGSDVEESKAEQFKSRVSDAFGGCDVELQFGGQPIYYYILSAE